MKKTFFLGLVFVMMIYSPLATLCNGAEPTSTSSSWWDKFGEPKYGGTIVLRAPMLSSLSFDNFTFYGGAHQFWFERLWSDKWTLDRKIWPFKVSFTPIKYIQGLLAESWEQPDAQTIIAHIRKGVQFQDKPPVNGREFTAEDVVYHYNRMLGTGSGFTKPSPFYLAFTGNIDKIYSTDKFTVVFKFKTPAAMNFLTIVEAFALNTFEARESVEQEGGSMKDWRNAVGTGAWMLSDYVDGSSITYDKNPNYWGYDERHPKNRLPYADQLKILCIPDISTSVAALRTGKLSILTDLGRQQAAIIALAKPEIQQSRFTGGCPGLELRCDKEPFTDINVRKALQLAIDRKLLAESYYNGLVEGKPCGLVSPDITGFCFPYDEWPRELKDEYSYNPEKAKKMLAEAGYPNGFKTNTVASTREDLQLLQVIKAQFLDIGVDMEIRSMDAAAIRSFISGGKHDQMNYGGVGSPFPPTNTLPKRSSEKGAGNYTFNNDQVYDSMLKEMETATEWGEMQKVMVDLDRYSIEHHWTVVTVSTVYFIAWQPSLKGYSGEYVSFPAEWGTAALWARLWID